MSTDTIAIAAALTALAAARDGQLATMKATHGWDFDRYDPETARVWGRLDGQADLLRELASALTTGGVDALTVLVTAAQAPLCEDCEQPVNLATSVPVRTGRVGSGEACPVCADYCEAVFDDWDVTDALERAYPGQYTFTSAQEAAVLELAYVLWRDRAGQKRDAQAIVREAALLSK